MSKINFFSLGGMDEKDKNCFVLEIGNEMFLFNIGISIPIDYLSGIKKIIPDVEWVTQNANKIKGIFIGYASKNNIGAFQYIYQKIKNIPIYSSELGIEIINSYFNKRNMRKTDENFELNLVPLQHCTTKKCGNVLVTPFRTSTSIPNSLGFIFHTDDGDIVYLDDFYVCNDRVVTFSNDFLDLRRLLKKKVILLINGIGNGSRNIGFTSPNHKTKSFYTQMLAKAGDSRLVVSLYDHDIHSFLALISLAKEKQIPFTIYNPIFFNIFSFMASRNLINTSSLLLLPIQKINEMKKGIVVLLAPFDKLFEKLLTITSGEDEILKLKKTDVFVLGTRTIPGFEKNESDILDRLSSVNIDSYKLPKTYIEAKASIEDHKYLINLLRPKYIIPTNGLYYETIKYRLAMKEIGFNFNDIFSLYNGEIISIVDGQKLGTKNKFFDVENSYVGNQGLLSEGSSILVERKVMAENGVIFFVLLLDSKVRTKIADYKWSEVGVAPDNDYERERKSAIKNEVVKYSQSLFNEADKNTDMKMTKYLVKKFLGKQIEKTYGKMPIIIVNII